MFMQKNSGLNPKIINDAIRLFSSLANLNFEFDYNNHVYFQYLSNSKNDVIFLDTYHPNEIFMNILIGICFFT